MIKNIQIFLLRKIILVYNLTKIVNSKVNHTLILLISITKFQNEIIVSIFQYTMSVRLNVAPQKNSYVEALITNVISFGYEVFMEIIKVK